MNETARSVQQPITRAEVKATHFGQKGEVLFNPPKEQPKTEGKLEGILRALRKQELPQQPEGPKHVLETLQELNLMERSSKAAENIVTCVKDGVKRNLGHDGKTFYDVYAGIGVDLDTIAQAKAVRKNGITSNDNVPELIETPSAIQQIFQEANPSRNATDHEIAQIKILKRYIQFKSRGGVRINLAIPNGSKPIKTPSNHLGLMIEVDNPIKASEPALNKIMERFNSKDPLLDISDVIVKYVEYIGQILPAENNEQAVVLEQKEKRMRDSEKWLVTYNKVKDAKIEVVPEENMARTPTELAEKMKDPKYLPSRAEIIKSFDNKTEQEFKDFCNKNNIYEFFNQEYIASLCNYLLKSIDRSQGIIYPNQEIRPITILEVGAGNGKLTYHLQQKMSEMGLRDDQVRFIATDDKSWDDGRTSELAMEVENLDVNESIKKYRPDIAIFSWMPSNEDMSPALRQDGINEYILPTSSFNSF